MQAPSCFHAKSSNVFYILHTKFKFSTRVKLVPSTVVVFLKNTKFSIDSMQLLEFVDYHSAAAGGRWPTAVGKCSDHPGRADEENQLRPLLEELNFR